MEMMKSIVIPEPGLVEIREDKRPALTPGHAVLKLLYGGICGSDMGTYKGTFLYAGYPRIPGHEFSAKVVEAAPNDLGIEPGMIVTANPYFNCGECYSCRRGMVNCCQSNQTMGAQRDGAFSQYISMPVERIYDGKGLSAQELALIEPFCIGYHAVRRGNVQKGDKVLVVGAGAIGSFAAMGAKMRGAQVYMADLSEYKLALAKERGVDGVIQSTDEESFNKAVADITGGCGFDVCIEAVGLPATFQNCIDAAAYRGRVVVVGVGKQSLDFFYTTLQTKELDIFGSRNALKEDFLELIDAVREGRADVKSIVSAVYPLEKAAEAFAENAQNAANLLKVMIKF